jgi:hypothetical protein
MTWQGTGNILSAFGVFAMVVSVLLRFRAGRWLLAGLWLLFTLGSLLGGDLHALADSPDTDADPMKASHYWLLGGGICLLLGLALRTLATHSI